MLQRTGSRDYRQKAALILIAGIVLLGIVISLIPGAGVNYDKTSTTKSPHGNLDFATLRQDSSRAENEVEHLVAPSRTENQEKKADESVISQAKALINQKKFDKALQLMNANHPELKHRAEAYHVVAQALEGRRDYLTARDFYLAALDRDPLLADAYFGYATASEGLGDLESALGGMRSYLHVERNSDPTRLKIAQARSAIWEWESQLGRGPWGVTRGIPPGFTPEELKRDGRGVGIKIPIPGTEDEYGRRKYEIKAQDKFQLFKP